MIDFTDFFDGPDDPPARPVCPDCFTEISLAGECGMCWEGK